jgi:hypothetical protein
MTIEKPKVEIGNMHVYYVRFSKVLIKSEALVFVTVAESDDAALAKLCKFGEDGVIIEKLRAGTAGWE